MVFHFQPKNCHITNNVLLAERQHIQEAEVNRDKGRANFALNSIHVAAAS